MNPQTNPLLKDLQDLIATLKNKPLEVKNSPLKEMWLAKYERITKAIAMLAPDERKALEKEYEQLWSESQKKPKTP